MLEHLFGSRTRVKLLRLFLLQSKESFYVREITRKIEERINSVRRELKNFENIGLVIIEEKDDKKYYKADSTFILFSELKTLMMKSQVILEKKFVFAIKTLGAIQFLLFTGFFVGDDACQTDMLIVGAIHRKKLDQLIQKFEKLFNHKINYTVMDMKEFLYRRSITDKFLYSILENKNIVVVDKLLQKTEE